jgi:hypothetical protein
LGRRSKTFWFIIVAVVLLQKQGCMLADAALVVLVAATVIMLGTGTMRIISTGFIATTFGALICALLVSLLLSVAANAIILHVLGPAPAGTQALYARSFLTALAQPTIGGIALLAVLFVLTFAADTAARLWKDSRVLLSGLALYQREADATLSREAAEKNKTS